MPARFTSSSSWDIERLGRSLDPLDAADGGPVRTDAGYHLERAALLPPRMRPKMPAAQRVKEPVVLRSLPPAAPPPKKGPRKAPASPTAPRAPADPVEVTAAPSAPPVDVVAPEETPPPPSKAPSIPIEVIGAIVIIALLLR